MLKPAILYKDEIQKKMAEYFYTDDMMYVTGYLDNWIPDIKNAPDGGLYQWAIVDNDKLVGYLGYYIDWYVDKVYNFGIFSFDRGNVTIGKDIYIIMEKLVKEHHRVEWRMVGGNHVEKVYDKFCFKHGGNKYVLKDAVRDRNGNYHDDIIYEIVKSE